MLLLTSTSRTDVPMFADMCDHGFRFCGVVTEQCLNCTFLLISSSFIFGSVSSLCWWSSWLDRPRCLWVGSDLKNIVATNTFCQLIVENDVSKQTHEPTDDCYIHSLSLQGATRRQWEDFLFGAVNPLTTQTPTQHTVAVRLQQTVHLVTVRSDGEFTHTEG